MVGMMASLSLTAQTKSYAAYQVLTSGPYGPIADIPQNQSIWVKWSNDMEYITMGDGTQWVYICDYNGNHHYQYNGGSIMPNTIYDQAVFSNDYSQFSMFYSFGMAGMMMQMRSDWKYIGEGTEPSLEWMKPF